MVTYNVLLLVCNICHINITHCLSKNSTLIRHLLSYMLNLANLVKLLSHIECLIFFFPILQMILLPVFPIFLILVHSTTPHPVLQVTNQRESNLICLFFFTSHIEFIGNSCHFFLQTYLQFSHPSPFPLPLLSLILTSSIDFLPFPPHFYTSPLLIISSLQSS